MNSSLSIKIPFFAVSLLSFATHASTGEIYGQTAVPSTPKSITISTKNSDSGIKIIDATIMRSLCGDGNGCRIETTSYEALTGLPLPFHRHRLPEEDSYVTNTARMHISTDNEETVVLSEMVWVQTVSHDYVPDFLYLKNEDPQNILLISPSCMFSRADTFTLSSQDENSDIGGTLIENNNGNFSYAEYGTDLSFSEGDAELNNYYLPQEDVYCTLKIYD